MICFVNDRLNCVAIIYRSIKKIELVLCTGSKVAEVKTNSGKDKEKMQ